MSDTSIIQAYYIICKGGNVVAFRKFYEAFFEKNDVHEYDPTSLALRFVAVRGHYEILAAMSDRGYTREDAQMDGGAPLRIALENCFEAAQKNNLAKLERYVRTVQCLHLLYGLAEIDPQGVKLCKIWEHRIEAAAASRYS